MLSLQLMVCTAWTAFSLRLLMVSGRDQVACERACPGVRRQAEVIRLCMYRAYFNGAALKDDPQCREFVEKECVNIWIGHDVHMVQNTLRDGKEFNWILTHKDVEDIKESWFQPGDMDDVRKIVQDVDPRIRAAVIKTKECLEWKICYRDPIPSWVSKSHRIALLGDSCHPHLPTSAQGASQATESGAVLAVCLKLAGKDNIPLAVSWNHSKRNLQPQRLL